MHKATGKIGDLLDSYGLNFEEACEQAIMDGTAPAICTSPDCDYTTDMEPDQSRGYCEACGQNTVASILVLAEMI